MAISEYLSTVRQKFESGQATEHSYRPALEKLFKTIVQSVEVINEPRRLEGIGAPDFVFTRKGIPVGWCEHKDLKPTLDIRNLEGFNLEQKQRYSEGLSNLIYTNGIEFEFIYDGTASDHIAIARLTTQGKIEAIPENFTRFIHALNDFVERKPQSIQTADDLAERMSRKAVLIRGVLALVLQDDEQGQGDRSSALYSQYQAFRENLIQDIATKEFADLYAETLAYGLFAARLNALDGSQFSRTAILHYMPRSNPFLHELFGFIAGASLQPKIALIIEDLCTIYRAADMSLILKDFGKSTAQEDPFIHFYETFLAAYDPAKRKARGVWYTPEPVVNFIVRAVDEVLVKEFGLSDGMADTSKVVVKQTKRIKDKDVTEYKQFFRVQILDPAAGSGTFLIGVIKIIAERVNQIAPGYWNRYIEHELIPRVHGFELLMASYAVCFMKIELTLKQLKYIPSETPPRFSVYLTNSLEEGHFRQIDIPFAQWLANEANEANQLKTQTPIMCIIGNPPYAGHSSNKGKWIKKLIGDYKVSDVLKRPAQAKWLSDDYVKFIRFATYMIDKNGEGILGFITNHSYLDNPTFMDMRHHLLNSFNKIYIVDLHGNSKKKERSPDGSADTNVFDIMQGVALIIAFKKKQKENTIKPLATVNHIDVWGSREAKYQTLLQNSLSFVANQIVPQAPQWIFKQTDFELELSYNVGFRISELFSPMGRPAPGIVTTHDEFAISWSIGDAKKKVKLLLNSYDELEARLSFKLCSQDQWNYKKSKAALAEAKWENQITPITYRPFDVRYTIYNQHVAVHRRERVMNHFLGHHNIGLSLTRQQKGTNGFHHCFIHDLISESSLVSNKTSEIGSSFPLYLYPQNGNGELPDHGVRLNFDPKLYAKICKAAGLKGQFIPPQGDDFRVKTADARPDEVKVFDYIYGYLHDRNYRETYSEFLKSDFPRIPFPTDAARFNHYSGYGEQLRRLHLMEDSAIGTLTNPYLGAEGGKVGSIDYRQHRIYINREQYFDLVPPEVWEFTIGGYQPAQKWLKDRKGLALSFDEVKHYQKILKILNETQRLMDDLSQ
ncbi:MAG: N-6 DNA methylase [Candidatus Pacebacteria bacterium]|nr:N-6 DNA methylase [Candidatus Paceibacterota bacterium]